MTHFWGKDVKHDMKFNYQAGAFLEYKFANSRFAIAPEVVFAAQGTKVSVEEIGATKVDYDYNVNYVNVPVMAKFYVTPDFSIDFGPQLGVNVYSKVTMKTTVGESEAPKVTEDIKDHTKDIDFGLGLGGTYNLSENAFVQARYTMGLTKAFENGESKNGNIQVAFGYRF